MNEDGRVIQYGMESGINNSLVIAKCIKSDSANPDVAEIVETACQTPHVIDKKKQMLFSTPPSEHILNETVEQMRKVCLVSSN